MNLFHQLTKWVALRSLLVTMTCCTLGISSLAYGQGSYFDDPKSPSADAASLGKFGDIPVSHHTGVPSISVPLYTVTQGNLSVPISMNYHSGGIKVDEVAGSFGLGWSMSALGMITRTVKGAPDEGGLRSANQPLSAAEGSGWYKNFGIHPGITLDVCMDTTFKTYGATGSNGEHDCHKYFIDAANGDADTEPDIYTFSFMGYSGKFFFDEYRNIKILDGQDLSIEVSMGTDHFDSWIIITPDGTRYHFGGEDATEIARFKTNPTELDEGTNISWARFLSYNTWYLHKIESVNQNNWISFEYESNNYGIPTINVPSHFHNCAIPAGRMRSLSGNTLPPVAITKVLGKQLKKIKTSSGAIEVDFGYSNQIREDLSDSVDPEVNSGSKVFDKIVIKVNGIVTKGFDFDLGYFVSPTNHPFIPQALYGDHKRLRLNSIREYINSDSLPPYRFEYDESDSLCRRLSLARDHWGYYNGRDGNEDLIPSGIQICNKTYGGDFRNSNPNFMGLWLIKKITYPTKGSSEFEFESHRYTNNEYVGGMRVKKIINRDSDNTILTEKNYEYHEPSLLGGYPTAQDYLVILDPRCLPGNTLIFNPNGTVRIDHGFHHTAVVLMNPRPVMGGLIGYHIAYGLVEENDGPGNGKTEYYYKTGGYAAFTTTMGCYPIRPAIPILISGLLDSQLVYNEAGDILKKEIYTYEKRNQGQVSGMVVEVLQANTVQWTTVNPPNDFDLLTNLSLNFVHNLNPLPLYNEYIIQYGRVDLVKKVTELNGLVSEEFFEFDGIHGFPKKEYSINSEGTKRTQETTYFDDHWTYSQQIDYSNCITAYNNARTTAFLNAGLGANGTSHSPTGTFGNDYKTAQVNYNNCLESVKQQYEANYNLSVSNIQDPSLREMVRRKVIIPLEGKSFFGDLSPEQTGGMRAEFSIQSKTINGPDHLLPEKLFKYNRLNLQTPGFWSEEKTLDWDEYGNIISAKHPDGPHISYIWREDKGLLLAKIQNAETTKVAYTSFDKFFSGTGSFYDGGWELVNFAGGGWSNALGDQYSGTRSYNLYSRSVRKTNLPAGEYILTFWFKDANVDVLVGSVSSSTSGSSTEWKKFQNKLTLAPGEVITISSTGNARIDELRIHPADAFMTTYTYDEKQQLRDVIDINCIKGSMEYDDFGRLIIIRDQDGNIIEKTDYHYKNQ